ELQAFLAHQATGGGRFLAPLVGEFDIDPAGEAVVQVPLALAVARQYEFTGHCRLSIEGKAGWHCSGDGRWWAVTTNGRHPPGGSVGTSPGGSITSPGGGRCPPAGIPSMVMVVHVWFLRACHAGVAAMVGLVLQGHVFD